MSSHVSSKVFFIIKDKQLVLWDYHTHKQYSITSDYLCRLVHLTQNPHESPDTSDSIDLSLLASGVLSETAFPLIEWGWDDLSKIFHFGTSQIDYETRPGNLHEWAKAYQGVCENALEAPVPKLRHERYDRKNFQSIELTPPSPTQDKDLLNTLLARRSVREFLPTSVTKEQLEHILYYSLAYMPSRPAGVSELCPEGLRDRRTSPSGGGLNAVDGYVFIRNVEQIPPGFYYYNPATHQLEMVKEGNELGIGNALNGQFFAEDLPFGVFLVCQFDRLWWKYPHSRAYRVALLDAGHISQTVQLISTSLGLSTWVSAAIDESWLESVIGDLNKSSPLLFVGAGASTGRDMPAALEDLYANGRL